MNDRSPRSRLAAAVDQALEQRRARGGPGATCARNLAGGAGWSVDDIVCTHRPGDRAFEERHDAFSVSVVVSGTFQYRSARGSALLTPGAALLGNGGEAFECSHQHGAGDRCIAFRFEADHFDRIAADAGATGGLRRFALDRLPPIRDTVRAGATAGAGALGHAIAWEEFGIELAVNALRLANRLPAPAPAPRGSVARVSESIRTIERAPAVGTSLQALASRAALSPFHYLRTFERITGVTPHQYVRRAQLREAATRLLTEPDNIIEAAFAAGFADLSTFNRAFRAEFGVSPRTFRTQMRARR